MQTDRQTDRHVEYINFYYQTLHNNSLYSYMFRLPIVAIIRELLFTDVRSVLYVSEW
jgi:hypothetical protein